MLLQLYIQGYFFAEIELRSPEIMGELTNRATDEMLEQYFEYAVKGFKNRYAKAMENKDWEIYLVIESALKYTEEITEVTF